MPTSLSGYGSAGEVAAEFGALVLSRDDFARTFPDARDRLEESLVTRSGLGLWRHGGGGRDSQNGEPAKKRKEARIHELSPDEQQL
jgi:hypothetical protein